MTSALPVVEFTAAALPDLAASSAAPVAPAVSLGAPPPPPPPPAPPAVTPPATLAPSLGLAIAPVLEPATAPYEQPLTAPVLEPAPAPYEQPASAPVLEPATALLEHASPAPATPGPSLPAIPAQAARPPAHETPTNHNLFHAVHGGAVPATLPSRRIQNAMGAIVRTLVIAGIIAALVFGGRYAWKWNQDREAADTAALPTEPVAPIDAKFASIATTRETPTSSGETRAAIDIDLSTGDLFASVETTLGNVSIARLDGVFWANDAAVGWAPMSPELLSTYAWTIDAASQAAVLTISDVIPADSHPYVTVLRNSAESIQGTEYTGDDVLDVGDPNSADTADVDEGISTSGNSDAFLDDTLDDVINPALAEQAGDQAPAVTTVRVRQLIVSIDRDAMADADPHLAVELGFDQPGTVQIELWVDRSGVIRRMTAPDGATMYGGGYELVGASSVGQGPLAGVDFSAAPVTEEGQP